MRFITLGFSLCVLQSSVVVVCLTKPNTQIMELIPAHFHASNLQTPGQLGEYVRTETVYSQESPDVAKARLQMQKGISPNTYDFFLPDWQRAEPTTPFFKQLQGTDQRFIYAFARG